MKTLAHALFLTLATAALTFADHGPGTSGSGANTETAETLRSRQWSAALKFDWTEFDPPSDEVSLEKDHFDLIDRAFLTTLSISVGVTDDFQIGLAFGYYAADGTREIGHGHEEEAEPVEHADEHADEHSEEPHEHPEEEHHEEEAAAPGREFATFDPDGWTDLWLTAKYRAYRGPLGQIALFGGLKFPVGEARVFNSDGERVEPAATAGSGAWDGMIGAAYTQSLAPSVALDASAQYTIRGQKHDYRLGNRFDAGVALGWRIVGAAGAYPQVSLHGEANVRSIAKAKFFGEDDEHTGGTVLFLSPGVRVRFCENSALTVGVQIPVVQDLNGDQVETDFRLSSSFTVSF